MEVVGGMPRLVTLVRIHPAAALGVPPERRMPQSDLESTGRMRPRRIVMKTTNLAIAMVTMLATALGAVAGQADSSASASSNGRGPGTASATAGYQGNGVGFTHTNAKSGNVNIAEGLSFGFDEQGLSLSSSFAVAPRIGSAAAGTFNLALGLDGDVSYGVGRSAAAGDSYRSVEAGGSAAPGRYGRSGGAVATASGRTGPRGVAVAKTSSHNSRVKIIRRVAQRRVILRRR